MEVETISVKLMLSMNTKVWMPFLRHNWLPNWCSSSIHNDAVLLTVKLSRHCCTLTLRGHVSHIRFTVTLIYRSIQVTTIAIGSIELQQVYLSARIEQRWLQCIAYIRQNVNMELIKTKKYFCCTFLWLWKIKYSSQWLDKG